MVVVKMYANGGFSGGVMVAEVTDRWRRQVSLVSSRTLYHS